MSCDLCGDARFVIVERNGLEAAAPCECQKRRIQEAQARQARINTGTPMTPDAARGAVRVLAGSLSFFPRENQAEARAVIGDCILRMCHTVEQMHTVVRKAVDLYSGAGGGWDKCGVPGLRQILSGITTPKDGLLMLSTETYPDGIPTSASGPPAGLPPGTWQPAQLPPGRMVTAAPDVDGLVAELAAEHGIDRPRPYLVPVLIEKPKPAPMTEERRTEVASQLERAKAEYREQQAARAAAAG